MQGGSHLTVEQPSGQTMLVSISLLTKIFLAVAEKPRENHLASQSCDGCRCTKLESGTANRNIIQTTNTNHGI